MSPESAATSAAVRTASKCGLYGIPARIAPDMKGSDSSGLLRRSMTCCISACVPRKRYGTTTGLPYTKHIYRNDIPFTSGTTPAGSESTLTRQFSGAPISSRRQAWKSNASLDSRVAYFGVALMWSVCMQVTRHPIHATRFEAKWIAVSMNRYITMSF